MIQYVAIFLVDRELSNFHVHLSNRDILALLEMILHRLRPFCCFVAADSSASRWIIDKVHNRSSSFNTFSVLWSTWILASFDDDWCRVDELGRSDTIWANVFGWCIITFHTDSILQTKLALLFSNAVIA